MGHSTRQQPPAGYPGPNNLIVQQQPATIPYNRRWHIAKIVVRGWSALLATLVILIDIVLAVKSQEEVLSDDYSYAYTLSFTVWIASLPPAALVLLWDIAEFITLCVRRKSTGRGIHPGAHVGVDLVLWLVLLIFWGSLAAMFSYSGYRYSSYLEDTIYYSEIEMSYNLHDMAVAILVFLILLSVVHFFLFVRACVETDQRRKSMRNGGPVMVVPAANAPYYNLNSAAAAGQPMWFQPASHGRRGEKGPQVLQTVAAPVGYSPTSVQRPSPAHSGATNTPPQPPRQQPHNLNPQYTGFYAPLPSNPQANPSLSGYYAPSTSRSVETPAHDAPQQAQLERPQQAPTELESDESHQVRPGTAK